MKILFQGDSITDCGRSRENNINVGTGYALLVKSALGFEEPAAHEFLNRGISGNRIVDVYARIKKDIINLKPDVMSLLIGVNDVWHELGDDPNGVDNDKFFKIYCMLIEEIKEALPDLKLMILEPFCLAGTATTATEAKWQGFSTEVPKRAAMAKKVAEKYGITFIPLQEKFDKLCESAPADYWLIDGVHPTAMGHQMIAREWIKAYKTLGE